MDNMSIKELTEYQQEIIEDIVLPMTKEADALEDFASKRYTAGELLEFRKNKDTTTFHTEYKKDQLKLKSLKEHRSDTAALDAENRAWEAYNKYN